MRDIHSLDEGRRVHLLVSSMTDYAIYMLDADGLIASWNAGAQRFKGYPAAEVLGRHFSMFYTPEDRSGEVPKRALESATNEGRFEEEGWRVRKDGSRFWAHVVIEPVYDEHGYLLGYAKVTRDITDRVAAEEALRASERRFRLFMQSVSDYAIYMIDTEGCVANWNAGAEHIKGYTEQEIIGRHFSCFYTQDDQDRNEPQRSLRTALVEGKYEAEGWRVRKDGTRFLAHVVIDPIYEDDGELIGYAKITRDVTERRKTEETLQQTREALFQSQKMEAVGQLTGGIAHDFNNLLTIVVNSLDILSRKPLEDRERRLLENAQKAAERGAKLTHQLLAFSRRQTLNAEINNINQLIEGFASVLRGGGGAEVALAFDLASDLQLTKIDAAQFEAALLNLVVNARDAMPDGGNITISTMNVEMDGFSKCAVDPLDAGSYVAITVRDSGGGIPPELQKRIFEPFFTTKDVGKGTGLGLSQVYGFVTQSGGSLEIVRSDASGTSLRFYLPVCEGDIEQTTGNAAGEETLLSVMTVLIVEDEDDVRDSAVTVLESIGASVLTASSAQDALAVLQGSACVDVLFADIVMRGGRGGYWLAREARNLHPGIGILLTSGSVQAQPEAMEDALFLPKPYRSDDLLVKLAALKTSMNAAPK